MLNAGHLRRSWLLLAIAALLWHALHPLSAPLLARAQAAAAGEPFAEICTTLGIKRLPLAAVAPDAHADHAVTPASSAPVSPATPLAHGDGEHCPWCRLAGGDLAPAPSARQLLRMATDTDARPAPPAAILPAPPHRPQHARGPPVFL